MVKYRVFQLQPTQLLDFALKAGRFYVENSVYNASMLLKHKCIVLDMLKLL
jgi:hypothetical protein